MPTINLTIDRDPQVIAPITTVTAATEQQVDINRMLAGEVMLVLRPVSALLVRLVSGGPAVSVPAGAETRIRLSQTVTSLWLQGEGGDVASIAAFVGIDLDAPASGGGSTAGLATAANQTALNDTMGSKADSSATTDAGTFSLIALIKRMLGKLPPLVNGMQPVEPLGALGVARTLAAGSTAASVVLTTTCRRVSLVALTADICIAVDGSTATTSSHYLQAGERIDLRLTAATTISAIRAGSTDGVLRVSELT